MQENSLSLDHYCLSQHSARFNQLPDGAAVTA
jgi:hypothetical protein